MRLASSETFATVALPMGMSNLQGAARDDRFICTADARSVVGDLLSPAFRRVWVSTNSRASRGTLCDRYPRRYEGLFVVGADPNGGYNVKRGTSPGGPYTTVGTVPVGTGFFTNRSAELTNGTTYYYVVTQNTTNGESANSNEVSAVPKPIAFQQLAYLVYAPDPNDPNPPVTDTVTTNPFDNNVNAGALAGALIVVWMWYKNTGVTVSSVTDTVGNHYYPANAEQTGSHALSGWRQEIWYAPDAAAGAK